MKRPVPYHVAGVLLAFMPLAFAMPAHAAEDQESRKVERVDWVFAGFRGQYDRAQLKRGFQVFQQVCSACHGLKRVSFRNLAEAGGPEFPVATVKALAAAWPYQITDGPDDQGKMIERLPNMADPIIGPYKNDNEARVAQGGALPPDLSLIVKARTVENEAPWYTHWLWMLRDIAAGYQEGGADYVYGILTGYSDPPPGTDMTAGMSYNLAFPGRQISMPPPLSKDNFVQYQPDAGATGSLEQNARDVTAFLAWASDPHLDARKAIGWRVLLYLVIATVLLYLVKRRIWSGLEH